MRARITIRASPHEPLERYFLALAFRKGRGTMACLSGFRSLGVA